MNGISEVSKPWLFSLHVFAACLSHCSPSCFLYPHSLPARKAKEEFLILLLIVGKDVNPPVHAWSVFRVFKLERKLYGRSDLDFLGKALDTYDISFLLEERLTSVCRESLSKTPAQFYVVGESKGSQ